jgi:hypothetical protein
LYEKFFAEQRRAASATAVSELLKSDSAFPPENCPARRVLPLNVDVVFLLDIAARADAEEGIRQGLENAKEGKLRTARQFFDEFDAAHGISR